MPTIPTPAYGPQNESELHNTWAAMHSLLHRGSLPVDRAAVLAAFRSYVAAEEARVNQFRA